MKKTTTFLATILIAVGTYAQSFQMSAIGPYNTGIFDDGAAEITAYDSTTQPLFFVNAANGSVQVLDISNPASPVLQNTISLSAYGASANSVAFNNGILAAAVPSTPSIILVELEPSCLNKETSSTVPVSPPIFT